MPSIRLLAPLAAAALLAAPAAAGSAPGDGPLTAAAPQAAPAAFSPSGADAAIAARVNAFRASHGLLPVEVEPKLDALAERYAADNAARGQIDRGRGAAFTGDLSTLGYAYVFAGFLDARNRKSADDALAFWMENPGLAQTMLSPQASMMGFAAASSADGQAYYTLIVSSLPPL